MCKTDENYDLMKIPDHILLKDLNMELGKLKSYIEELEYENKLLNKKNKALQKDLDSKLKMSKEERKEILTNTLFDQMVLKISDLEFQIYSLKNDKNELIMRLLKQ